MSTLKPRNKVPDLSVETLAGRRWTLSEQNPKHFTMLVFYRGLHCPKCKEYLQELEKTISDFAAKGVNVIAISTDTLERANMTQSEWKLKSTPIGYGFPIELARKWGLYVSSAIKDEEPAEFVEPAVFLVKNDGSLYGAWVQSMPFARPSIDNLLGAVSFIIDKAYPARGER